MGLFDQYNQAKLGPENDYQQAIGMLGKGGGGSVQFPSYDGGSTQGFSGKELSGLLGSGDPTGEKLSVAPEASGGQPATPGNIPQGPAPNVPAYDMPMRPQSAMGMVAPKASPSTPWPAYTGNDSGGGGGMDAGSMSSIASAFM